jgi:ATP phosphoribosyltransferase regulatory subunit
MTVWLLPDNIADMLPRQARTMERMRRTCLDLFEVHGFELVKPPLIEYADSLLTGSGRDVTNNTFRFMDQTNGRVVGIRADMTPQIARIDAHILNRKYVTRLCYAGSCLHARPMHPLASREPEVTGCELFGAQGIEADIEMLSLAVETLRKLGVKDIHVDIGHVGIVRSLLDGCNLTDEQLHAILRALRQKDPVALAQATSTIGRDVAEALETLRVSFGGLRQIQALSEKLPRTEEIRAALDDVQQVARHCGADHVSFDFCDVHGYQYLTGVSFAVHVPQYTQAVLRGGRYDGVGLAFGRSRPACGFTVYLRALAGIADFEAPLHEAIVAPGVEDPQLDALVRKLRDAGRIVVRLLPGESLENVAEHFVVTHEIVRVQHGFELVAR